VKLALHITLLITLLRQYNNCLRKSILKGQTDKTERENDKPTDRHVDWQQGSLKAERSRTNN